ncbi:hypothetical protein [Mycobacterium sp. 852014-52144_SCH5372336]|uniref:hypothetical protein n=1 Tax=Mycobacterium sp. 852014-52144_SCH5372336 TaxID=1834115 RepID=UPI000800BF39|nr:hypothetical protein [Mycobacterium sp. 852014-52144_SCH5372336]OBB71219.1 hypothetical protein A5759_23315 [Mycobacterium sp. 852014-52144_SCH5372336]
MRLSVRDLDATVATAPDTARPIRMRLGALTYCMTFPEAINLANQLADAATALRPPLFKKEKP